VSPISRGFRRKREEAPAGRVPPGQYVTRDFPVLSAGPTPRIHTRKWELQVRTETGQVHSWDWDAFLKLPSEDIMVDVEHRTFLALAPQTIAEHWKLYLTEGIVLLVLGIGAILVPVFASLAVAIFLGWLFLAAYAGYVWTQIRNENETSEGEPEPLKFQPRTASPGLAIASAQTLLALVVIFAASHVFVNQLAAIGPWLGLPSAVVALLLSPIATELPETMNAIIWIRQGKHRLALGNISGSMMIQAAVPTALGLFFTPWLFDHALALAAAVTCVSIFGLLVLIQRNALTPLRLAAFALLYVLFAAGLTIT